MNDWNSTARCGKTNVRKGTLHDQEVTCVLCARKILGLKRINTRDKFLLPRNLKKV